MKLDDFRDRKGKEKIVMLTAYDSQIAKILDQVDIDIILIGDSLGMVFQGNANTRGVTMRDMVYHTQAVARGANRTPIVADMPFRSDSTVPVALRNARRLLEAGAQGVKIEGRKAEVINALIEEGIPVMAHIGLLPQTATAYRLIGKTPEDAERIMQDAIRLDGLGVFSMVLESIPEGLAKEITAAVRTPTIGIGAGKHCDGQVLVINDMLGLDPTFTPKYLKRYADLSQIITNAVVAFKRDVRGGEYPGPEQTYH
ncbi:MAG TPA: 3-methyl-2-oxobutanoate hydroxymethyltransferase [Candidatus Methanomethylicus sp.]|nr:3-methyl-2-oxobutanoate hydroxymethyltransferase [Candidatus Methanomethylicus sp.]HRR54509.1 3-methyl-2-oxobutanoate hydroxymethyltransferase [Candidatus Methanomethylicus sp.]